MWLGHSLQQEAIPHSDISLRPLASLVTQYSQLFCVPFGSLQTLNCFLHTVLEHVGCSGTGLFLNYG